MHAVGCTGLPALILGDEVDERVRGHLVTLALPLRDGRYDVFPSLRWYLDEQDADAVADMRYDTMVSVPATCVFRFAGWDDLDVISRAMAHAPADGAFAAGIRAFATRAARFARRGTEEHECDRTTAIKHVSFCSTSAELAPLLLNADVLEPLCGMIQDQALAKRTPHLPAMAMRALATLVFNHARGEAHSPSAGERADGDAHLRATIAAASALLEGELEAACVSAARAPVFGPCAPASWQTAVEHLEQKEATRASRCCAFNLLGVLTRIVPDRVVKAGGLAAAVLQLARAEATADDFQPALLERAEWARAADWQQAVWRDARESADKLIVALGQPYYLGHEDEGAQKMSKLFFGKNTALGSSPEEMGAALERALSSAPPISDRAAALLRSALAAIRLRPPDAEATLGGAKFKLPQLGGVCDSCQACHQLLLPSERKRCKGCLVTTYCSAECQRKHWKAGHRHECASLAQHDDGTRSSASMSANDGFREVVAEWARTHLSEIYGLVMRARLSPLRTIVLVDMSVDVEQPRWGIASETDFDIAFVRFFGPTLQRIHGIPRKGLTSAPMQQVWSQIAKGVSRIGALNRKLATQDLAAGWMLQPYVHLFAYSPIGLNWNGTLKLRFSLLPSDGCAMADALFDGAGRCKSAKKVRDALYAVYKPADAERIWRETGLWFGRALLKDEPLNGDDAPVLAHLPPETRSTWLAEPIALPARDDGMVLLKSGV